MPATSSSSSSRWGRWIGMHLTLCSFCFLQRERLLVIRVYVNQPLDYLKKIAKGSCKRKLQTKVANESCQGKLQTKVAKGSCNRNCKGKLQ